MYEWPINPRSVATSIRMSGAELITPNAFLTGRAIGASTARALTRSMTGAWEVMIFSSLDSIPSNQPRRFPARLGGLNQPAPRIFGSKGDAPGLPGVDRDRIEPKWFPTIIESVKQPEVMAMQMNDDRGRGPVDQGQDDRAAEPGVESGRAVDCECQGPDPIFPIIAKSKLDPKRGFQVEPFRKIVGRKCRRGRKGILSNGRLFRHDQPGHRSRRFSIVQQDR